MQRKQAGDFILDKLRRELAPNLSYHNTDHINDVYRAAEQIGRLEDISEYDMELLLTAAYYHDSGYLKGVRNYEEESCRIARAALPGFDYSKEEIDLICGMIMATRIPQSPGTFLERVIADADLDYLGRDDFFPISEKLFRELSYLGVIKTEDEWNRMQVAFLESHHYFTHTSLNLRDAKKQENLEQIKQKLKQIPS